MIAFACSVPTRHVGQRKSSIRAEEMTHVAVGAGSARCRCAPVRDRRRARGIAPRPRHSRQRRDRQVGVVREDIVAEGSSIRGLDVVQDASAGLASASMQCRCMPLHQNRSLPSARCRAWALPCAVWAYGSRSLCIFGYSARRCRSRSEIGDAPHALVADLAIIRTLALLGRNLRAPRPPFRRVTRATRRGA